MKNMLRLLLLFGLLSACAAQTVSYESVRLAEMFISTTWKSTEAALPVLASGIQAQFKGAGASDAASKVFAEEVRRSLNKDNLTKAMAQAITNNFTDVEQRELAVFVHSTLGQKFLEFNKDATSNPKYYAPILKTACTTALQRLSAPDRSTIASLCNQF